MFKRFFESKTHKLTEASFSLTMSRRRPVRVFFVLVFLLALSAAGFGFYLVDENPLVSEACRIEGALKNENLKLRQSLAEAELHAKHETATRESLEKMLSEQSEEIKRLSGELAFFQKNRKIQPGRQ